MMKVQVIRSATQFQQALSAEKTVLLLCVEWSIYPQLAKPKFDELAAQISIEHPEAGIGFFIADEDDDFVALWLKSQNIKGLTGKAPLGWGAMLWLKSGEVTHVLLRSDDVSKKALHNATLKTFDLVPPARA